jgi:plastocyanin
MTRGSITRLFPWVAALALTAAGCASQGSAEPPPSVEGPAVAVRDYEFEPASLTIEAGTTVTWVWEGRAAHDVVGQGFESNDQTSGTFRHTFDEQGTYAYECTIHPGMEGRIVAEGAKH